AGVLALGAGCVLAFTGSASWAVRVRRVGTALAASGALSAVVLAVARWQIGDLMMRPPSSWPPSVGRLLDDVQHGAADALLSVGLITSALPLAAGLALAGAPWAYQKVVARRGARLTGR
ncbi:hypothetical protein G3I28_12275, partial [Streptomyces sp. SID10116]|nr:hypothetical protein [Streptomyces sp. SID10116]